MPILYMRQIMDTITLVETDIQSLLLVIQEQFKSNFELFQSGSLLPDYDPGDQHMRSLYRLMDIVDRPHHNLEILEQGLESLSLFLTAIKRHINPILRQVLYSSWTDEISTLRWKLVANTLPDNVDRMEKLIYRLQAKVKDQRSQRVYSFLA
jgi:hypothetical protein